MPQSHAQLRHQLGLRLRRLRQRHGLTQAELARRLELSPSYLNQIERNQRPLTLAIQQRLKTALGELDGLLDLDDPAALVEPLDESLRSLGHTLLPAELRALTGNLPQVAQALLDLHRAHQHLLERNAALELQIGVEHAAMPSLSPGEQVRDYFNRAHNYLPELDERAEALCAELGLTPENLPLRLRQRLAERHGLLVQDAPELHRDKRSLDAQARVLWLPAHLRPGQQAFQMAAQLALLECAPLLDARIADAGFADAERIALADWPVELFRRRAGDAVQRVPAQRTNLALRHRMVGRPLRRGLRSGVSPPQHLAAAGAAGLPIFFMRVDRAGNVSKRHSATDFHFSHVGGACPLWIVYEAFNQPDRILTQIARMPDGRRYFWLARQVSSGPPGYGRPRKTFALAMGCDLRHADQLVYARGWDLNAVDDAVPIGPGCLTCERSDCVQRAFPALPRLPARAR